MWGTEDKGVFERDYRDVGDDEYGRDIEKWLPPDVYKIKQSPNPNTLIAPTYTPKNLPNAFSRDCIGYYSRPNQQQEVH
ncbi:hypothetical protein VE04_06818, partial [Pseudogymnoascus sp. 24MN13]